MSSTPALPALPAERYATLADLLATHDELLELQTHYQEPLPGPFIAHVAAFAARVQASGVILDSPRDRRAAQGILDYWSSVLFRAGQRLAEPRLAPFNPELAPILPDGPCPYQGLSAFRETDSTYFFGREAKVDELLNRLRAGERFLAVVGASGSGKSSIVLAGLLPRLKAGEISGSQDWHTVTMVPGADPLGNLDRAIRAASGGQDGEETAGVSNTHLPPAAVLVIDQFEELFTLTSDNTLRQHFAEALAELVDDDVAGQADGAARTSWIVVITLRSDYIDAMVKLPALAERFRKGRVELDALDINELRAAIERPAARVGLKFDDGIIDDLITNILGERAGLPLLQFTLLKVWQQRDHNRITREVYQRVGNPREALNRSADAFYNRLMAEDQEAVRRILLKMVRPSADGLEFTSNRIPRERLFEDNVARDRVERVLARLVTEGLVKESGYSSTDERGEENKVPQVEVAHEALVRNWPRLVSWLDAERETLRTRFLLSEAARRWEDSEHDPAWLLRGRVLTDAEAAPDLSEAERAFVRASRKAVEAEAHASENARARQQRLRQAYVIVAVLFVSLAGVALAAIYAFTQQQRAEDNAAAAQAASTHAVQQQGTAEAAGTRAVEQQVTAQAAAMRAVEQQVTAEAASTMAVAERANAQRQAQIAKSQALAALALANQDRALDLSLLLTIASYQVVETFEARSSLLSILQHNPRPVQYGRGHTDIVVSVAFSPDGKTLASASYDKTIRLWDVSDPHAPQSLGAPLTGHTDAVRSVAFSPDGKTLASASYDKTIRLWDVGDPHAPQSLGAPLTGHTDAVRSVAFSPDGKTLASASDDKTIRLWDVGDPHAPQSLGAPLTGHTDAVRSVAFSPDGKTLASASDDKTIRLWDVGDPHAPQSLGAPLIGHTDGVASVAFSPDGKTLASASYDKTIRLWDVGDPHAPQSLGAPLIGYTSYVLSVAFSPDGKTLASASYDKTIRLWDVSDPHAPQSLGAPLTGHTDAVVSVTFSPDGKTLASASFDRTILLWDVSERTAPQPLGLPLAGHTNAVRSVAFSPDGKTLASASDDKTIRLWDVGDPHAPQSLGAPLTGHTNAVVSVAFSPDGKTLASASADGTILLWDVSERTAPQPLGLPLTGHMGLVVSVAFSPDGKTLASASEDQTIRLWDIDITSWIKRACRIVNRNLTQTEWRRYLGDELYRKTCPDLPAGL